MQTICSAMLCSSLMFAHHPIATLAVGGDERGEPRHGIALRQARGRLLSAGAPAEKAAEAAEEVADVVELLHRMERRLVRVAVLVSSTLGGVGLVAAGVLATMLKVYFG